MEISQNPVRKNGVGNFFDILHGSHIIALENGPSLCSLYKILNGSWTGTPLNQLLQPGWRFLRVGSRPANQIDCQFVDMIGYGYAFNKLLEFLEFLTRNDLLKLGQGSNSCLLYTSPSPRD